MYEDFRNSSREFARDLRTKVIRSSADLVEQQVVNTDARFDIFRDGTGSFDLGIGRAAGRIDGVARTGGAHGAFRRPWLTACLLELN